MNLKKLQTEVPFDQFSRQYQVASVLNHVRKNNETFTILDAGGYRGRSADFLEDDSITVLDLYEVNEENYVKGSALDMPFADQSFDFVLSFDVLEHIPADQRNKFFDECNRVARRGVIICAPHKTVANEYAETSLNKLYATLHGKPHEWLKEHIEYGIPDFALLESYARKQGLFTVALHSNKTQLWLAMQQAIFINSKYDLAAESLVGLNEFYNKNFMFDGGGAPEAAYRLILCAFRDEKTATLVRKNLTIHNEPISSALEIRLQEQLGLYMTELVDKTSTLAKDYKNLHTHEKKRAEQLQINGEELLKHIDVQQAQLDKRMSQKLRRGVTGLVHKKASQSGDSSEEQSN